MLRIIAWSFKIIWKCFLIFTTLPDSSEEEPKSFLYRLKSDQGSESLIPGLEALTGGLE